MPDPKREFRKLWVGQTISEIGSRITREGLPLTAVLMLGATPAQMGILAAVGGSSVLIFSVAAGIIADRVRRRPLMIWADLGRALLLGTIPMAAAFGVLSFTQLLAVAVLAGILTVQFDVAYQSYLPSLVPREDLLAGNRRLGMSASFAEILGPSLTGVLIQLITAPIAILFDAISFLVSAGSVLAIGAPEPKPTPHPHASLREEAMDGARTILAHPILRALAFRAITTFFAGGVFFSLYALYAIRVLHLNTASLGFAIAMGGVGALVGAYFSNRIATRFGVVRAMLGASVWTAVINLLIPLASHNARLALLCMCAAQFFGDAGWSVNFITETTFRQQSAPEHVLGRVNAAMQLASRGILPLGALAGGFLAQEIGVTRTLWLACSGALLSTLWLIPVARKQKTGVVQTTDTPGSN